MKKKRRTFVIISTNCDCCSDIIVRYPTRYLWGPRCPHCGKVLGWMQWFEVATVRAINQWEAEKEYRQTKNKGASR